MACRSWCVVSLVFPLVRALPSPSMSGKLIYGRCGIFKTWPTCIKTKLLISPSSINSTSLMQSKLAQNLKHLGIKLSTQSFLGFSTITAMVYSQQEVSCTSKDQDISFKEPAGFMKDDIHTFWALVRKYQLPMVLLLTVLLGWRHPITLAIQIALLLFSTRPDPLSVYIFIEQLCRRRMQKGPNLFKSKFFYVRKVNLQDYKLLCVAKVDMQDTRLTLMGILGGWWVLHTSSI